MDSSLLHSFPFLLSPRVSRVDFDMDLVRSIESQREREKREERREIKSGVGAFERRRRVCRA